MEPKNGYKTLSIVLAIVAVVFIILYFSKPSQPISDTYGDITAQVEKCRTDITTWQKANDTTTPTKAEQDKLSKILEACKGATADSQEKI